MEKGLVIDGVGKRFGAVTVLDDVNAAADPGCITAFVGPNGAGKTTLLHVVSGALEPDKGRVLYRGREITGLSAHRIARRGIGRQFQDARVMSALSVEDNLVVGMLPERYQRAPTSWFCRDRTAATVRDLREQANQFLDAVELSDLRKQPAGQLSFGQQKLLALARLLARGCSCLLLDEPTAGVAPHLIEPLVEVIRTQATRNNLTVTAFVEHNMPVVQDLADQVYFMDEGRIELSGRAEDVLQDQMVRRVYMGIA